MLVYSCHFPLCFHLINLWSMYKLLYLFTCLLVGHLSYLYSNYIDLEILEEFRRLSMICEPYEQLNIFSLDHIGTTTRVINVLCMSPGHLGVA